ncbi:tyrosine-protein kinase RYK, partial [Trichonephila clavata]
IAFLHDRRIIHRDIATRNCVVDDWLQVRLTDNALARDLFPGDYHCLGDNENRPIKWLAIESLLRKEFSYASDVWAFGVTMWELITLGQQPYIEIDPFEMHLYLRDGYRLDQPKKLPRRFIRSDELLLVNNARGQTLCDLSYEMLTELS